jgi:hypothetical protein
MLMNNVKSVLFVVGLVLISGCATMSKEECQQADWYLKGVDDASIGYPLDRVVEHGKACARVHVVPDMKAYRSGHEKGARLFCVPPKGYIFGRAGGVYSGLCPADLEPAFLTAYHDGQELFTIEIKIKSLESELNGNHNAIEEHYHEIEELKRDVVYSNDERDRRNKMQRIDDLERDIHRREYESDHAAHELDAYRNDFRIVQDKHYRMGYIK